MIQPTSTRFAPSPTGSLHVGGLRTALYNFLIARAQNGKFFLRIEDTDQARKVAGADIQLQEILKKFNLTWDNKKVIYQSQRIELYQKSIEQLITSGHAYRCFCSSERLEQIRHQQQQASKPTMYDRCCRKVSAAEAQRRHAAGEPAVVRLKTPQTGTIGFTDLVRGEVSFAAATIDDQVLLKSDGFPTYHLANVVDDHEMGVTLVIRGEEWLPSTPKHILIYQAFQWELPKFAHLPLLLNPDKSKLSKRQGDVAVEEYLKKGYLPEALLNFVLLLGWNPGTEQEIFSLEEMIKNFKLEQVNKSGSVFDTKKLDWINGQYVRKLSPKQFCALASPHLAAAGLNAPPAQLEKIVATEQKRIKRFDELPEMVRFFFEPPQYETSLLLWKKMTQAETHTSLKSVVEALDSILEKKWNQATIEKTLATLIEKSQRSVGEILWPLRAALSGRKASPGPFEIAAALGKKETTARLETAINKLEK